ncbi:hypothetical protein L207DRAFT_528612 [Hyaloscypha variabilis F]|uniref:Uncharacterized protein n=1 Tax=Hyaloscypha variabilis (strain UAMH 11265 / GT02V1 / F) TaxID=1149755 RepID=A0A2J6RP02_HYAVF|nr:hypothetical protein L207DRAFT_528612 [Hyaloscypha variabilis F]
MPVSVVDATVYSQEIANVPEVVKYVKVVLSVEKVTQYIVNVSVIVVGIIVVLNGVVLTGTWVVGAVFIHWTKELDHIDWQMRVRVELSPAWGFTVYQGSRRFSGVSPTTRPVAWDVVARDAQAEEVDKFADVGGNEDEVENNSVDPVGLSLVVGILSRRECNQQGHGAHNSSESLQK